MGFHILVSLQSCQDNYVGVYVRCSGYELGHYFLLLIHAEENPAVLSIQACTWKLSALLLDCAARAIPNTGPSKTSCCLSQHIRPPPPTSSNEERGWVKYPRPTADPPQCHSNSWHIRSPAGVFVSFSLQPEQETLPKVQRGHILLHAEFKEDRQTSRPATLPEPRIQIGKGGGGTATFYLPKKSQNALWSVRPPCPFSSAVVPWCHHVVTTRREQSRSAECHGLRRYLNLICQSLCKYTQTTTTPPPLPRVSTSPPTRLVLSLYEFITQAGGAERSRVSRFRSGGSGTLALAFWATGVHTDECRAPQITPAIRARVNDPSG